MSEKASPPPKKKLVLGISGGIAAYKCADLVRRLTERNFEVRVVLTPAATNFITPMTLQAVSGNPVHQDLFDPEMEAAMGHIELAKWADYILIAPATANTLAKLVHGEGDNLLTTVVLASQAQLVVAPAMNQQMWANQTTQINIEQLRQRGVAVLGPGTGEQACGDVGAGRMLEPLDIALKLESMTTQEKKLTEKRVVITAGPTVEAIDPVRYISNHSSGKMAFALAKAAKKAGAEVEIVSGPVNLADPAGVTVNHVTSAAQMFEQVKLAVKNCDIFIGCAAVADYTPVKVSCQKIKKNDEQMTLELKRNPDILAWVAEQEDRPFVVGFAAESQSLKEFATKKLHKKKLDMICANDISCEGLGFNSDDNQLLLLDKKGNEELLDVASKEVLACKIINQIVARI
ncbi:bifunctional phosphopantothenoylcysteine decarboxylase/phosphopantothenate--cysteine ligase CoaBC [Aliikangiella coralliicola]|uniref:Coenzyme A biosynthesis bifunctional protein CoaBC n=1 Tax=Aliikangiella coralliicola TaxID=2592383 RepID=A0A545UHL7_9GAMM|nr:bifunctional phosphopantothenoylcysteine decarboxylase/phosphopantothenate--cysteine ligase CoaBC [Aliikangiella coralliicola]TQV88966.1 bifunctional phosphopantothenoylcysteine decarboxylase/phosphopantothenate--cysteine ligase CoaBC [Aliikangiella coralliicola]